MERGEMPVGFAMALAQNHDAMEKFAMLSEDKKRDVINGTHTISSRDEMHRYVSGLVSDQ